MSRILIKILVVLALATPAAAGTPPSGADLGSQPTTARSPATVDFHSTRPTRGWPAGFPPVRADDAPVLAADSLRRRVGARARVRGRPGGGRQIELEQAYVDFLPRAASTCGRAWCLSPSASSTSATNRRSTTAWSGRLSTRSLCRPPVRGRRRHPRVLGRSFRYRTYIVAPLNAIEFSAKDGVRGGRQKVGGQRAQRALTGRLEYRRARADAWGQFFTGVSAFKTPRIDTAVTLGEFDARLSPQRLAPLAVRAGDISDAARLNDSLGRLTGVSPNIASGLCGFSTEAGYRIWNQGSPRDLVAFVVVRELRYAVPDAGRLPAVEGIRSRRLGHGPDVLPGSRHRREIRLHAPSQPERHFPAGIWSTSG